MLKMRGPIQKWGPNFNSIRGPIQEWTMKLKPICLTQNINKIHERKKRKSKKDREISYKKEKIDKELERV